MYFELFVGYSIVPEQRQDIWQQFPSSVEVAVQACCQSLLGFDTNLVMKKGLTV